MHVNNYNTPKLITDENTVNPVLSGHSKETKKKIFKTNRLMQVKNIAECSREHSAILSNYIKLKSVFTTYVLSIFEWPHKTGFTVSRKLFCSYSSILEKIIEYLSHLNYTALMSV